VVAKLVQEAKFFRRSLWKKMVLTWAAAWRKARWKGLLRRDI